MGLDMYLDKMPRFESLEPKTIMNINEYFHWKQRKAEGSKYANCTLKKWCGVSYSELPRKAIKFFAPYFTKKYSAWDEEHKYGHESISESVGYWRKANAIHSWFVSKVQNGEDDCGYYEVSKESLEALLEICKTIKEKSQLVKGKIKNGYTFENGVETPIYEDGEYITNPEVAARYLPTQSGFFFGSTEYDQWYMRDIEYTIELLTKVIAETDFDTHMIVYSASW